MEFRTPVEKLEKQMEFKYSDHILLMGSCFAENIGKLLHENKFSCDINPFGVLYNPLSIAKGIHYLLERKMYEKDDLFFANGQWHSWMHHSSFSAMSADECLSQINERLEKASNRFPDTTWLIMTWGSAYVYEKDSVIVGNCHKQPERSFVRRLLGVDEIVEKWNVTLQQLKRHFPTLKVMLSVSPIRHLKDGLHSNQISKSTLMLAAARLCSDWDNCYYFPSYEIMMDELRDYRFYAEDMLHPSDIAVKYIWEFFTTSCMNAETRGVMKQWQEIQKALSHRPFSPESEAYHRFLSQIVLKISELQKKFPYFDLQKEMEQCQTLLKI